MTSDSRKTVVHDADAVVGTLEVLDPAARLSARGGRLVVETDGAAWAFGVADVDEVHAHGRASVSSGARGLLLREGIDLVFFDGWGRLAGRLTAHEGRNVPRRLAQLRACLDDTTRLRLARGFVTAKLAAQEAELLRARTPRATEVRRELREARLRV